jgi:hypothetical protein
MTEQGDLNVRNLEYLYLLANYCITYTRGFMTTGHIFKNLSRINL